MRDRSNTDIAKAKQEIEKICKASQGRSVICLFGSSSYKDSVRHWLVSSSENAYVAVQPGSVDDLSAIIKVLARRKVPFGIKGGGHATSPRLSSTSGIQIYMARFDLIQYNSATDTVDIGAGCLWDQVYKELLPYKRSVVGGSTSEGVGVAGWLLGGGYSLKTNQYGLGIDNIVGFEIVMPSGNVINVRQGEIKHKDLFEALKGGGNNFGIVTKFIINTFYEDKTYTFRYTFSSYFPEVKAAIADFAKYEIRKKAALVSAFMHELEQGSIKSTIMVLGVYDGPKPNPDPFRRFDPIAKLEEAAQTRLFQGSTTNNARDMPQYQLDNPLGHFHPPRNQNGTNSQNPGMSGVGEITSCGRFACTMVSHYTTKLIETIAEQAQKKAAKMKRHRGKLVCIDVWPFLPSIFEKSTPSAWPHPIGKSYSPCIVYFLWDKPEDDQYWLKQMNSALKAIHKVAIKEKCTKNYPMYLNTSLDTTPVERIYGRMNLGLLSKIRKTYDPDDVMGHASGFKIPLPDKIPDIDFQSDHEVSDDEPDLSDGSEDEPDLSDDDPNLSDGSEDEPDLSDDDPNLSDGSEDEPESPNSVLKKLKSNQPLYQEAEQYFKERWVNPDKRSPSIRSIYEVVYRSDRAQYHVSRYSDYLKSLRNNSPVEQKLFHGQARACTIGDDTNGRAHGTAKKNGYWGWGIYTTSASNKADHFFRDVNNTSPYRLVFLSKVAVGLSMRADRRNENLKRAPPGYDSIDALTMEQGGVVKYSEVVVYPDEAMCPYVVIVYSL
ncbi:hypothetical protein SERLA73DRAFT_160903 [Serpula lacrymans var. lacrymans S7.3]|uniref:FAD-binding PCMH-type domain-containing protein n=2 Tax=Serpula lacrymans var. lacrymans TaxID=341189 RepID=F8Q0N8_SERL3|nr:uncharacterized protein SERLADRAFT_415949 [Serpula lacrymans var. lacrymans S7.9]EGN97867.1 hypothetical protein SERLA73DRAFT_160903 [Serpula lacrymans var. lacrymans S7.3]EGO23450.1 hypothetical protein SERLADRAFT_415949 [Serpula lacrymans var. lacrymans S7.9]